MVLSSAVTEMDVDVATIAVSGLSFYYSSVAVAPVLAATAVDATTLDADANFCIHKKECFRTPFCDTFITSFS